MPLTVAVTTLDGEPDPRLTRLAAQIDAARDASRMSGPVGGGQPLNLVKVTVSADEDHAVMFRRGSDPDVIFRKWPALFSEALLHKPVFPGNIEIARQNRSALRESLDLDGILRRTTGFRGPEEQLPQDHSRDEHLGRVLQVREHRIVPSNRAMTMLVSSKNLPLAGVNPLTLLLDCLCHLPC